MDAIEEQAQKVRGLLASHRPNNPQAALNELRGAARLLVELIEAARGAGLPDSGSDRTPVST